VGEGLLGAELELELGGGVLGLGCRSAGSDVVEGGNVMAGTEPEDF
jgi:hypothetical protein